MYSKSLPLDVASRVWDLFCRDGDELLFRTALGKISLYMYLCIVLVPEKALRECVLWDGKVIESMWKYLNLNVDENVQMEESQFVVESLACSQAMEGLRMRLKSRFPEEHLP